MIVVCSQVSLTKYWLIGLCVSAKYESERGVDEIEVEREVEKMMEYTVPDLFQISLLVYRFPDAGAHKSAVAQRPATTHSACRRALTTTPSSGWDASWGVVDIDILRAVGELLMISLASTDRFRMWEAL